MANATGEPSWSAKLRPVLLGLAVAVMVFHCWQFRDFTVDDAAISYSYAKNFATGHGLIVTAGAERVEGYTNFLWVILLAFGIRLGIDVFLWAKLLGLALAASIPLGLATALKSLRGRASFYDATPGLLAACFTPVAYWSMSGLENPLYMAAIVWCLARLCEEARRPEARPLSAALAVAIALTRPDGIVVWVAALATRVLFTLVGRGSWRGLAKWFGWAAVPVAAFFLWRFSYYAYPWPNTFYVKIQEPFKLKELWDFNGHGGWRYLRGNLFAYFGGTLLAIGALTLLRRRELSYRLALAGFLGAVIFFPLYARFDWMAEGRFVAAIYPLGALAAADAWAYLSEAAGTRQVILLVVGALALPGFWGRIGVEKTKARRGHYPVPVEHVAKRAHEYARIVKVLGVEHGSVLDGDLGGTSYYSGLEIVDLGALSDVTLARHGANPGIQREYVYGERRPTILRIHGFWTQSGLLNYDEYAIEYAPLPSAVEPGLSLRRDTVRVRAIDVQKTIAELPEVRVVGRRGREVWFVVRVDGPRKLVFARDGKRSPVVVASDLYPRAGWRKGEVLRSELPDGSGEVELCNSGTCVKLPEGGSVPVAIPPVDDQERARAERGFDWDALFIHAQRRQVDTTVLGRRFYERGRTFEAAGEITQAVRDYRRALLADASQSFARKHLEALRHQKRDPYHPRWRMRLDQAERAFSLAPDAANMERLVFAATLAEDHDAAVLAHLATGILPASPSARLELGEAYSALGLASKARSFLPQTIEAPMEKARLAEVRRRAGESATTVEARDLGGGLALVHVDIFRARSGRTAVSLALRRTNASPEVPKLNGRPLVFRRAPAHWENDEIYFQTVEVDTDEGLTLGTLKLPARTPTLAQNFESGRWDGWVASGNAMGNAPSPYEPKRDPNGCEGERLVSTVAGPERQKAMGELVSPVLSGVDEVCFVVAGTRDGRNAGVTLQGPAPQPIALPEPHPGMHEACIPVGTEGAQVLVFDRGGDWISVDDFEFLKGGRLVY